MGQHGLLVHDDHWRRLWVWYWICDWTTDQSNLPFDSQHLWNCKGCRADCSCHSLVPRGQALVVVVFQRSGLGRLAHVRESAPVGDGCQHRTESKVEEKETTEPLQKV